MTVLTQPPLRQIVLGFAAGVLLMALFTLGGTALAQTPSPTPLPNVQQMIEWCRQTMAQPGVMMQGMMSGTCMGH